MPEDSPTMRAFRWDNATSSFNKREIPVPAPGAGEIRIKVAAAGVCLSDVHWIDGSIKLPYDIDGEVTMGHEIAGIVDLVGPVVSGTLAVGDRVLSQVMRTTATGAVQTLGFDYDGGWSDFMIADTENLVPIPDSLPFEQAAIIPDAVSTPWAAITSTAQVRPGEAVGVWGIGGLGAHAVKLLRLVGAAPIVGVDVSAAARERALEFGADYVLDPLDPGFDDAMAVHSGGGVDVALEVSGVASAQKQAIEALRPGGRMILIGVSPEPLAFETWAFMNEGKCIRGHYGAQPHHTTELVELIGLGRLDLASSISAVLPLDDVQDALHRLDNKVGDPIRIVLQP
jgi:D-arabinose 1-dehydrogenase-like Zn-dependent alcohol dehydrogenase